ncbi:MAG: TMEM175 family protein [Bacteroidota bacterium]
MIFRQSKSRLESISDSIFAFAATLVVVSLDVPESFDLLKENLMSFFSFGLSFFALILLWKVHYNFFRRTDIIDNWVIGLNMILMFVILFFVYPLKFLAYLYVGVGKINSASDLAELFQLYGLGFALVFLCMALMYRHVAMKEKEEDKRPMLYFYARHYSIFVIVALFSIIAAYFQWGIRYGGPGFAYVLLGPLCGMHGRFYGYEIKDNHSLKTVEDES